eukprot:TRINITY_DN23619_c0_g1_i1.p3 TRINITY_DN23619_c0_g1~~TRINITY_DN23619_c0_g1_i1.p3  ORF type:complete len:122 (+),score=17.74 TRINITY_DN23619_c0_g1_i1:570-935(+)
MVREWEGPTEVYETEGVKLLWMPIVDFTSPGVEDLERAVFWIRERIEAEGKVYLHCKAGKGRSGTVAMAYLISVEDLSPVEAQTRLLERRPQVLQSLHKRPEIQEYWQRHQRKHESSEPLN